MDELLPTAEKIGTVLTKRGHTIAVAESSAGGLVSAALLSVPGASAFFLGGAVVYTAAARSALLGIGEAEMTGLRSASASYALLIARTVRERHSATWGVAETGAAGPTGNRYGDAAGHACVAVSGPIERIVTIETGETDRVTNMRAFAAGLLDLLEKALLEGQ
jgi:nicotinamide-nucleotide amidase